MKFLVLFSIVCLSISESFGQVPIGVQGGINLNDFRLPNSPYDFDELYNPNIGLHLGIFTTIAMSDKFNLRPQFQIVQRGSYLENSLTQTKARTNLIYAELPFQVTYQVSKPFFFSLGPTISYLLYGYTKSDGKTERLESFPEKPLEFGLTTGIGWRTSDQWSVLMNYYFAISAMHRHEIFNTQTFETMPVSFYNSVVQISIAYDFPSAKPKVAKSKFGKSKY